MVTFFYAYNVWIGGLVQLGGNEVRRVESITFVYIREIVTEAYDWLEDRCSI